MLEPDVLARIARLELVATQAVEGFLSGLHPSPFHGSSVEYADHRPYSLGDEIRTIDWKLLAKTDKYYVKLFEDQTNLRATILLDASKSMGFGSGDMSKLEYGGFLAAALAYLMLCQNDAVGLVLFDQRIRHYLPARAAPSHFKLMTDVLEKLSPASETRVGPVLHELASRLKQRGMIILISDLLDDPARITDGLSHFRYKKHEIIVFHVMDPAELAFPYERLTRFKDAEGTAQIVANPASIRKKYLKRLEAFLTRVKGSCFEQAIGYELASTDTPYDQMLSAFLEKRSKRR